ncbi:type I methionyl aminopeptidase [Aquipuribacter nitratireducens]|uniref:Methionine aminopeptidase n=1 Tax=Aquipuribacter nitratireducens TaxID=650104 RepID=A0ABW0GJI5_9MICO
MFGRERIEYKTVAQVRTMRRAGLVVAAALDAVRAAVRPGVTTAELDEVAARVIADAGATSNFLGYHGYPRTVCSSVDDEVVHGIPGDRVLRPGQLVSVDCGAVVDGWHGDAAFSVLVPDVDGSDVSSAADRALVAATEESLWRGIAALRVGEPVARVGEAVDDFVTHECDGRYGLVEEYTGHGIGTAMHQPPEVLNYRAGGRSPRVRAGLCVAVEPMLTAGSAATRLLDDGWTVVTADGSRAAHVEHSVAVLADGLFVLTAPDGGRARLEAMGVRVSDAVEPAAA